MTNDLLETHLLATAETDAVRTHGLLAFLSLEILLLHGASLAAAVGLAAVATVGAHLVLLGFDVFLLHGASLASAGFVSTFSAGHSAMRAHLVLLSLEIFVFHGASLAAAGLVAAVVAGHTTVGAHLVLFGLEVLIFLHGASLTAARLSTEAAAVAARHTTVRAHPVLLFDQVIVSLLLVDGAAPTSFQSFAESAVDATAFETAFTADEVSLAPGTEATFFGELVLECGSRNDHTGQQDLLKSEALL